MPEGAVYVGRPSRWGNPFTISRTPNGSWDVSDSNDRLWTHTTGHRIAVERAVELFALHVGPMGNYEYDDETLADLRKALSGHDLACWCPLDQPCHADVLLELANST